MNFFFIAIGFFAFFNSVFAANENLVLPVGTLISFSTQNGEVAHEGEGKNSPFTIALSEHLTSSESLEVVLKRVRQNVSQATSSRQQPMSHSALADGVIDLTRLNNGYSKKLNAHALIVGNAKYEGISKLLNPVNDANRIAEVLLKLNFFVTTSIDRKKIEFFSDISNFEKTAKNADITLFFFAGHGAEILGQNYLLPIDIVADSVSMIKQNGITVQEIIERLPGKTKLIFLDANRDDPFIYKSR